MQIATKHWGKFLALMSDVHEAFSSAMYPMYDNHYNQLSMNITNYNKGNGKVYIGWSILPKPVLVSVVLHNKLRLE